METSKSLPPITRITKYTLIDEVQQRSFVVMFVFCALCVFLVRGCYQGNYMVNGQILDAGTIVRTLSKATFHVIGAGVMVIAALLSMRIFRRDRNEGMQACILSKPIARWQYVMGKILGLWVLSTLFMLILHSIVFLITSINLQVFMPEYLVASLLCSINLLFVVIAVLLLSLMMSDIVAFLCVLGVGAVGFVADGIAAASQSQIGQAIVQQSVGQPQSDLTWWKVVYFFWPKLLGVQQLASSLIESESSHGFGPIYPLINVLVYCLILGALLFKRFRNEDIV
ncbi:ABC transporter permease subunit [Geobacter pelophilus]|uniref:ABC transporter permease subunit n=1 Tax=Geoanaerobacter pelophilus TaxID=60036 RepID=A0AAW4L078_9BACT|nr:ABC transporter permease subunit [Geoanaerobacter pelophilus]MBT0663572.1 ABC transporter permease subunit [Geoanaerobacter pelophilus]NTV49167.1 ABC transporter permease subunit [Geobacteraceae bacterium]NTW79332.1 ABC transporter permease subunit [Geobacteraceae bacterium]